MTLTAHFLVREHTEVPLQPTIYNYLHPHSQLQVLLLVSCWVNSGVGYLTSSNNQSKVNYSLGKR